MQKVVVSTLMKAYGDMHAQMSSDVDVFHFLALVSKEIDDVKVLEVSTEVVSKVHAVSWVAARRSPVGGMSLQGFHSRQTQSVLVPVLSVLVHWGIVLEGGLEKSGKLTIFVTPRHDQGPCSTGLRLQITVSWETVSTVVVKFVDATFGGASQQIIKAGGRTEYLLFVFSCFRTGISLQMKNEE